MTRRVIEVSADPERFALAVLHPDYVEANRGVTRYFTASMT